MKKVAIGLPFVLAMLLTSVLVLGEAEAAGNEHANEKACWGQATQVFAQTETEQGEPSAVGRHSSSFETPRLGLPNLARLLFEDGVIEDDSMQALGAFVEAELGLGIDACM